MVEGQILNLPVGLVLGRSVGPVPDSYAPDDLIMGCAVTRNLLATEWYASEFRAPTGTSMEDVRANYTVHWGPFPSQAAARANIDALLLTELDNNGSNLISLWLVLP